MLEGGFQVVELEQAGQLTPNQISAGLDDNSVRYYGANAAVDISLTDHLSLSSFFKFEQRNNDIPRDTALFGPANGTQVDPDYAGSPFAFTGDLDRVVVTLTD